MSPAAHTSLKRRKSPLADASEQLRILSDRGQTAPTFEAMVREKRLSSLVADGIEIMQVNVGKLCNMTCRHCHVDAGPDRREAMTQETVDQCLTAIERSRINTLDLTGGAPEMNPHFKYFVREARRLGVHVIDRCNLTILLANGYQDLPEFLASEQVEIVASLPCYLEENTDAQRGEGAFRESIEAIKRLNHLGYAAAQSELLLTLVYNPIGTSLPPAQSQLEADYRRTLRRDHKIEFSRLFTITNMPISRFLEDLLERGEYESYMEKLINAFNPAALAGVMCRKMISVGWDGQLYDCDFNQMLDLGLATGLPTRIRDFDTTLLDQREIVVGQHCFGCTAAAGSGCLGAIEV